MGKKVNVKLVFLIIFIILVVASIALYFKIKHDDAAAAQAAWESQVIPEDEYAGIPEITQANFKKEVENVKDKDILVCFYAGWCAPWKRLEPIVETVARENSDVKVVKINADKNEDLTLKYDAYSLPVLIHFKRGVEVGRHTGEPTKAQIEDLID